MCCVYYVYYLQLSLIIKPICNIVKVLNVTRSTTLSDTISKIDKHRNLNMTYNNKIPFCAKHIDV